MERQNEKYHYSSFDFGHSLVRFCSADKSYCKFRHAIVVEGNAIKMTNQEIQNWIDAHSAHDWSAGEIAKGIILEAINNTTWAEDAYPGLKDRLIEMVNNETELLS